jgi:hypothetical protein
LIEKLEFAADSPRPAERLRGVFEYGFSMAVRNNDDAILKFLIRKLDQYELTHEHWASVEPFLKRTAVHFGHVIDYVARIIVWRQLSREDLDIESWSPILLNLLRHHGRLGNDSEVCWTLYACIHLRIEINDGTVQDITRNCGALSLCAVLNCVDLLLVGRAAFDVARDRLSSETARGPLWPVILEWHARGWPERAAVTLDHETIADMAREEVTIFNSAAWPVVFRDVEETAFGTVGRAIEPRSSLYDDEHEEDDPDKIAF